MKILINLGSRLLSELMFNFLKKEKDIKAYVADRKGPAEPFQPDIIIVDAGCLDQKMFSEWPEAKILLIDTGLKDEIISHLLISYRIDGIISTGTDTQLFKKALSTISKDQIWIDNTRIKALLHSAALTPPKRRLTSMSHREEEIIGFICGGHTNKEIATKLLISEQTVKAHLNRIYKKLNVTNRSQAVALAMTRTAEGNVEF